MGLKASTSRTTCVAKDGKIARDFGARASVVGEAAQFMPGPSGLNAF